MDLIQVRLPDNVRKLLGLELSDEEIETLSKNKFKKFIQKKIENFALFELNELKLKHKKSQYLQSSSFKTAEYLVDSRFSRSEAQLLFKLRSQTLNIKMNFQNQHSITLCQICKLFLESQSHLLQCPKIVPNLKLLSLKTNVDENLIYGSVENQLIIVKIYMEIMEIRKEMLEENE